MEMDSFSAYDLYNIRTVARICPLALMILKAVSHGATENAGVSDSLV